MDVQIGNLNIVNDEKYSLSQIRGNLNVKWRVETDNLYTLAFYDENFYLYYLAINIPNYNFSGNVLMKYMLPTSSNTIYYIILYKHNNRIPIMNIQQRENFNIDDLVEMYSLNQAFDIKFIIGRILARDDIIEYTDVPTEKTTKTQVILLNNNHNTSRNLY